MTNLKIKELMILLSFNHCSFLGAFFNQLQLT